MNKENEAENTQGGPASSKMQLLFNFATLAGAVVTCAMIGPKIPPYAGD